MCVAKQVPVPRQQTETAEAAKKPRFVQAPPSPFQPFTTKWSCRSCPKSDGLRAPEKAPRQVATATQIHERKPAESCASDVQSRKVSGRAAEGRFSGEAVLNPDSCGPLLDRRLAGHASSHGNTGLRLDGHAPCPPGPAKRAVLALADVTLGTCLAAKTCQVVGDALQEAGQRYKKSNMLLGERAKALDGWMAVRRSLRFVLLGGKP